MQEPQQLIFKICSRTAWQKAVELGRFTGAEIDIADGFIHFSAAHQAKETAAKHFAGKADLVLVSVEASALGDELKWETSRGGDLFPHLYGPLDVSLAHRVDALPLDEKGTHRFPADLVS